MYQLINLLIFLIIDGGIGTIGNQNCNLDKPYDDRTASNVVRGTFNLSFQATNSASNFLYNIEYCSRPFMGNLNPSILAVSVLVNVYCSGISPLIVKLSHFFRLISKPLACLNVSNSDVIILI